MSAFFAVKVICDHKSGKSRGYGFVHFTSEDSASKALAEMDGQVNIGIIRNTYFSGVAKVALTVFSSYF